MTKKIPWDLIIDLIHRFPEGASLEQIMVALDPSVSRRTLQRWISSLIKEGKITFKGRARARCYLLPSTEGYLLKEEEHRVLIPLSKEGLRIQSKVSLPIQKRQPTRCRKEFLESYLPNHTHYLSESLRSHLASIGKVEDGPYPAGTFARQIFNRLLVDLSWNSSRLEGNTYSLLETQRLLELGKAAKGKDLKDTQMILNHKAAIEFLIQSAEEIGINRYTITNLHALLSDNLLPDPSACGRLRSLPVGITKSTYLPLAIPQLIEECFDLLLQKASQIKDPFEQSFFLMVQLPYIQAFDDVNKRTSRLAANIPLIRNNLCPLSFIDVPEQTYVDGLLGIYELNHIELLRDVFAWAYERSCSFYSMTRKTLGEPDPFRMKYHKSIKHIVKEIVQKKMDKTNAIEAVRHYASQHIQETDRSRFCEFVERELQSLHIGNITRFQLLPSEYEAWKISWL